MELPYLKDMSFSTTRRFVGQALRIPPATIVGEMKISPNHDPIAGYTDSALAVITNKVIPEESGVENTLGAAIEDMLYIGQGVRCRFNGSLAESINLFAHPRTVTALAQLALEPGVDFQNAIFARLHIDKWQLDPSGGYITAQTKPTYTNAKACPFAGYNSEHKVDPLFRKFVPWAGDLSMRALNMHMMR